MLKLPRNYGSYGPGIRTPARARKLSVRIRNHRFAGIVAGSAPESLCPQLVCFDERSRENVEARVVDINHGRLAREEGQPKGDYVPVDQDAPYQDASDQDAGSRARGWEARARGGRGGSSCGDQCGGSGWLYFSWVMRRNTHGVVGPSRSPNQGMLTGLGMKRPLRRPPFRAELRRDARSARRRRVAPRSVASSTCGRADQWQNTAGGAVDRSVDRSTGETIDRCKVWW